MIKALMKLGIERMYFNMLIFSPPATIASKWSPFSHSMSTVN
jgi:hypothetical protein